MSDPTIEDDRLISQDDIDKLLDSSSIEEAEEKFSNSDPDDAIATDAVDEFGELSQDDIDQLMNSNTSNSEDPVAADIEEDDMELISQDDIDQLMNSGDSLDEDAQVILDDGEDVSDDEFGELSQDDIDQLMNSNASNPEDPVEEEMDSISQDDINDRMQEQTADTEVEIKPSTNEESDKNEANSLSDEEESIDTPDEIDRIEETASIEETAEPVEEDIQQEDDYIEDDYIIDESEAKDVEDCLISQETIDSLIENFGEDAPSDSVILDKEPALDTKETDDPAPLTPPESQPESDELDIQEDMAIDDIEGFLKPDSDAALFDFDDEGNEDISQEDIDSLLLEDDDEDDDEDILISQDDIDTLLMAADQEDEDILGNLMDDEVDDSMDDESGDEDSLENDSFDAEEDDKDQVVLEGDDAEFTEELEGKKKTSRWYKSKLVMASASALIVLGITVPLAYFFFFPGGFNEVVQTDPAEKLFVDTQREIEIETVDIYVEKQADIKIAGNLILKDFVILTSDLSKDLAYVIADISLDYSDQKAYHEIQNNLSFYRDLIYDSINKSLVSEKRKEITEEDILWIVEATLKKVLPGHYIDRVSFKSFKAI